MTQWFERRPLDVEVVVFNGSNLDEVREFTRWIPGHGDLELLQPGYVVAFDPTFGTYLTYTAAEFERDYRQAPIRRCFEPHCGHDWASHTETLDARFLRCTAKAYDEDEDGDVSPSDRPCECTVLAVKRPARYQPRVGVAR